MATTEEIGEQFLNFMNSTFGLPREWFVGALFVFNFLIPIIGMTFLWYTFLYKKIGMFKRSEFANAMLALMIAFMSSPILVKLSPTYSLAVAIGSGVLLWGRFSLIRIILSFVIAWALTFFYPLLIDSVISLSA